MESHHPKLRFNFTGQNFDLAHFKTHFRGTLYGILQVYMDLWFLKSMYVKLPPRNPLTYCTNCNFLCHNFRKIHRYYHIWWVTDNHIYGFLISQRIDSGSLFFLNPLNKHKNAIPQIFNMNLEYWSPCKVV